MIALLAFLSQIWNRNDELKSVVLLSIALMGVGLVCAQLSATIRLRVTYYRLEGKSIKGWWNRLVFRDKYYIYLRSASFVLFIASGAWLIIRLYSFT